MTDRRLCFVGDSFVQGTLDDECLGWVGRVCAATRKRGVDLTGYNLGVRRDTSADIACRWEAECAARLPDGCEPGVLFAFGTNDTTLEGGTPRVDPAQSVIHLRRMLDIAARRGWPACFIGPPPIADKAQNERTAALSTQLIETAASADVPALDVFGPLRDDVTWRDAVAAGDGAHPGAAGYERLAGLVLDWLVLTWEDGWFR